MHSTLKPLVIITLLFTTLVQAGLTPAAENTDWEAKIDPWVRQTTTNSGETEFLLYLRERADISDAQQFNTKVEKGQFVYQQLRENAAHSQAPLVKYLKAAGVEHRPYWIVNMIWVRGNAELVEKLAKRADVERIYANPRVQLELPQTEMLTSSAETGSGVEWNIALVNAPQVWAAGYTGQGVVVGGQDTGYYWQHEALKNQYRGWDGSAADHNYSWHNAIHDDQPDNPCFESDEPCDDDGHGTHTMGSMVGDDGAENQIGMAPGAKWIGCRNMADRVGTPESYVECYQWFLAPTDLANENEDPSKAPDVINNSWKCTISEGCTDPAVLLEAVQNVHAAGIFTVHAAGNEGPNCGTVQYPAAIYDESFSVGATGYDPDLTGLVGIADFSSRGPVTVDNSNRLKPDITAPGQGIRSATTGVPYSYDSGTSMAAPHVAGLAALLISTNDELRGEVDALESVITRSAIPMIAEQDCGDVPGTDTPNNTYGWGRIDAWAAMHDFDIRKTASTLLASPGDLLTYTLAITHTGLLSHTHNVIISDTLPTGTQFLEANDPYHKIESVIYWELDSLATGQSKSFDMIVQVSNSADWRISNYLYGASSDEIFPVTGPPVITFNAYNSIWLPTVFHEYSPP